MPTPSERGGRLSRALLLAAVLLTGWPATAALPDPVKAGSGCWAVVVEVREVLAVNVGDEEPIRDVSLRTDS